MKMRDLLKTNSFNDGTRLLNESILVPEVGLAFKDWNQVVKDDNYVVIGGIALSYYTKPRYTSDVDVLFPVKNQIPTTLERFKRHRGQAFQHNQTHVEIEVLSPDTINMSTELAQAIYHNSNIVNGVRVASPSGLIASKLGRFKLQDQADIESIIESGYPIDLSIYPISDEEKARYNQLLNSIRQVK